MPNTHHVKEYPVARGHVHITDGEDVSAPIDFVPGYLESLVRVPATGASTNQHLTAQDG